MKKGYFENILQKSALIVTIILVVIGIVFLKFSYTALGDIIFSDIIPFYSIQANQVFNKGKADLKYGSVLASSDKIEHKTDKKSPKKTSKEENEISEVELIGLDDIAFEEKTTTETKASVKNIDMTKLSDIDYLKKSFYIVDKKTGITEDYFNVKDFLSTDITAEKSLTEPKVLIFHTHSKEMFSDSDPSNLNQGIVGAGARLSKTLEESYKIKSVHLTDSFDVVNGSTKISGAYERMEPKIRQVLAENPSIELVIDLHRDGVNENTKLATQINGKPTAKIMFFNGISRINENGTLKNISNLENPYVKTNLALSFNMQKKVMEKYPELSRKIYVNAYRYSLHMKPKSMLVEVGAQTNTKEEIYNAVDLLAEIINEVVFKG